jgi:hypothetical protein
VTANGRIFNGQAPETIRTALMGVMYEATQYLEREIKKETPVGVSGAQGGLLSTVHGEVIQKGETVVRGVVATQSAYGEVVEKGRRAGKAWPPEGALLRWIELKMGVDAVQAKRLEFVIRRKIGRKGFRGKQMFEKTWESKFPVIQRMFETAGFTIARKINE